MNNNEKLLNVFSQSLAVSREIIKDDLEYNSITQWDSTAHMALIAQLEAEFSIMLDIDDIIDMSSVGECKKILKKYHVKF
ncbi:MAG: acyl carrier protein [gamma proteobacterium symbiont of Taylorina sp.]|nr:acyl carrier protein [gamma proteobacterium symbiont of Taylorina sp.]